MTAYHREKQRHGRLPVSTKIYQGIGSLPDSAKNFAFNTFLLFYYNQVLGLPASWASLAIMVALVLDAISDPLMGSISDNLKTRLGRRHPLMYASVLPLALGLYLVFSPPDGLGHGGLVAWLLVWAVVVRTAMTFFLVPWSALYAEFSDDYVERSSIVTYRYLVGWLGGVVITFGIWTFVFPSTPEFTPGHLNPEGYEMFAPIVAVVAGLSAFLTTHLTRREIPYLLQPTAPTPPFRFRRVLDEVILALSNRDYLVIVLAALTFSAVAGADGALNIYMNTYFWGFNPEDLRWFALSIVGTVAAFVLVTPLQRRFDKKTLLIGCLMISLFDGITVVSLRFLDVLPANGDPLLLYILIANLAVLVAVLTVAGIMLASMVADLLDAQEYRTERRQEGVFSAALSFSSKATSGFGILIGGFILDYAVGFPAGVRPDAIDPGVVTRLGIAAGIVLPLFFLIPFYLVSHYRLTREAHAEIQAALSKRRAVDGTGPTDGAAS